MRLRRLWLRDFRCYEAVELELPDGCTVIRGANGQGKTSLLEAVDWLAHGRSFRGVPDAALVREGALSAIARAEVDDDGRELMVEAEIKVHGRNRVLVNGKEAGRRRDVGDRVRVTVFAPDDLDLVKGAPSVRRAFVDDLLVASAPRYGEVRRDLDRVLKQRNALLRAGVRTEDDTFTLEVFDDRLAAAGAELTRGRLRLIERLTPHIADSYTALAGGRARVETRYESEWAPKVVSGESIPSATDLVADLRSALTAARRRERDRGVTLVGPHRDDWLLGLDGMDARTHASQGEQRSYALALRLAGHRLVAELTGSEPVLLLDDVFSELDPARAAALVAHLPDAQTLLTTAGALPAGVVVARQLEVRDGAVEAWVPGA